MSLLVFLCQLLIVGHSTPSTQQASVTDVLETTTELGVAPVTQSEPTAINIFGAANACNNSVALWIYIALLCVHNYYVHVTIIHYTMHMHRYMF